MRGVFLLITFLWGLLSPAQAQKITVGSLRTSASGPLFIALDKNYFRDEGLEIEYREFTAGSQLPTAVMSGDVDFGEAALSAAFFNLAGKGALKIIASQVTERPNFQNLGLVVSKKSWNGGFRSISDIKGKRMAITTKGSSTQYALELISRKLGLPRGSYAEVPLQTLPNVAAALKGGQLDGGVVQAVVAGRLEADNSGKLIAWMGDVAPWQFGALFTSTRMILERRDVVEKVNRALDRGRRDYNEAFNQLDSSGKRVKGADYDEMLALLVRMIRAPAPIVAGSLAYAEPRGSLDVADIEEQVDIWQALGMVDKDVKARMLVDTSFVPAWKVR